MILQARGFKVAMAMAMAFVIGLGASDRAFGQLDPFGWGGWGGFGSGTVEGHALHGAGVLAAGLGQFNLDTAQADAINTETVMRLNEYLFQSSQIARENYFRRVEARKERRNEALAERERILLYTPSAAEVENGNAMNAMMRQLQNPSIPTSLIFQAGQGMTLSNAAIRTIPLKFASDGIIISLERLTATDQWPLPMRTDAFKTMREQFSALVKEVKERPEGESVADAKIVEGIRIVSTMREQARRQLSGTEFAEVERYLKGLAGMLQMARQPDIKRVLERAAEVDNVAIANLITFMDVYNLEFGVARNADERSLYRQAIYPMIRQVRDSLEKELGAPILTGTQQVRARNDGKSPTEALEGFSWERLTRTETPVADLPPAKP